VLPLKDDIENRRFPVVTVVLIALNALVFLAFQGATADNETTFAFGAIPFELSHPGRQCGLVSPTSVACGELDGEPPAWLTVLSSMFMHGGFLHLAGNMLFLWIFGNTVEDSMGRIRFVAFYLLGGVAALALQTLADPDSVVPTVGASGAVAGVLGGYALLYPRARVVTLVLLVFLVTVIALPALAVLGLWFLVQLAFGAADLAQPAGEGGGVAYFAHIGGFVFGLLLIRLFADRVHEDYESPHRLPVY
jgi:membrane associated rhomboid family serine protease